jgi:hypothetical protein
MGSVPPPPLLLPANAFADVGETVRKTAANKAGYGPTDVFYPPAWLGTWKMTRLVSFGDDDSTIALQYPVRFLASSINTDAVVADRGFNQAHLEAALRKTTTLPTAEWRITNPNDLRIAFPDGSVKDIKVTKRSSELSVEDGAVSSSEFQRVVQQEAGSSVPAVSARRVLTKWKTVQDNNAAEGLELVYDVMSSGDPLSPDAGKKPQLLSKSRLIMQR